MSIRNHAMSMALVLAGTIAASQAYGQGGCPIPRQPGKLDWCVDSPGPHREAAANGAMRWVIWHKNVCAHPVKVRTWTLEGKLIRTTIAPFDVKRSSCTSCSGLGRWEFDC